jgi:hypothetical protein
LIIVFIVAYVAGFTIKAGDSQDRRSTPGYYHSSASLPEFSYSLLKLTEIVAVFLA